ncbi:hypothetical protein PUNSTDRAFT_62058, partial [Punctularia strigosozonata HHB-11173 SS5]|uniref:uncharacterized protein n=1 Tax=Punctularia strigosozonata (strain HHB-11173) TaxID=741275 RepID=UPI0004416FD9
LEFHANNTSRIEERKIAASLCQDAIAACEAGHARRVWALGSLSSIIYRSFEELGSANYLDEAIEVQQRALAEMLPYQSQYKHRHLRRLGWYRSRRYESLGDVHDLEQAISALEEALRLCPATHIDRGGIMSYMLAPLYLKSLQSGNLDDMDKAIQLGQQALQIFHSSNRHPSPSVLNTVANLLNVRHQLMLSNTDGHDVNESVKLLRECFAVTPPQAASRWQVNLNLANTLRLRFAWSGHPDDLEEAIQLSRTSVDALPISHPHRQYSARNLADALILRFNEGREMADLDEGIEWDRHASKNIPSTHLDYSAAALNFISHLCTRFEILKTTKDLDEAVLRAEELLDVLPMDNINRAEAANHWANALLLRGQYWDNIGDVERAIQQLELIVSQPLHPSHATRSLRMFAKCHLTRFRLTADPTNAMRAWNIMTDLSARASDFYTISDRTTSLQLLDVYDQIIGLLPRVAFFGLHLRSRLRSLAAGQEVTLAGASHALNLGFPEKALEMLEQGRSVFWTHSLRLRSPFDDVPESYRSRLSALARQLERVNDHSDQDSRVMEAEAIQRRRQTDEFNSLLAEVRNLEGMGRFLLPDEFSSLARTAERGPVVVLVSSMIACHAIVIKQSGDAISIPLVHLTETWLVSSGALWRSAMADARSALRDRMSLSALACPCTSSLATMQPAKGRLRPRIWWCPTGQFMHLPLHAAGFEGTWCSDYIVSSYTPTLGALLDARRSFTPVKKHGIRALVVAVPRPDMEGWSDLLSTCEEVGVIRAILPVEANVPITFADNVNDEGVRGVTAEELVEKLPHATILHLACHGHQHSEDPLQSGFVMQDKMLTIEMLMPIPLPHAFMAFLSACETARGDKVRLERDQPDQAVHLAATLLFAGFKSVIATLW